jgi:hypothetical protein
MAAPQTSSKLPVAGVPAVLDALAAEFPGYEFATQQTWSGLSIVARHHGGAYLVVTDDLDELRRALAEPERDQGDTREGRPGC